MKVFKRSQWTAQVPLSTVGTEDMDGPPFFRNGDVVGISVFTPPENALFVELNPFCYMEKQRKQDYQQRGFGDIQYNLAVAPNVEGVWCLRGLCNKSPAHSNKLLNSTHVSVLCLLGTEEPPTDLLLQNLTTCRDLVLSRFPKAEEIKTSFPFEFDWDLRVKTSSQFVNTLPETYTLDPSVHMFDWIEVLSYFGYYKGRNDGVYGPVATNATAMLQADLKDSGMYRKRVDGLYGRYTREAMTLFLKS